MGSVCHEEESEETSGGVSLSLGKALSVHGEWSTNSRRTWEQTKQTAKFIRFGTPEHPVEEVVVYGSQLIGSIGTGVIKKLILVDKADTHAQDGGSFGLSVNVAEVAKRGVSAISSLSMGVKGGDSSRVEGGKAYFSVPGVTILEPIERVSVAEYDRRYGVRVTQHYTPEGQTPGAYDPAMSGEVDLGEHTAGFEMPNAFVPGRHTETTSQRLTRQAAEAKKVYEEALESLYSPEALEEVQRKELKEALDKFEAENPNLVRDELAREGAREGSDKITPASHAKKVKGAENQETLKYRDTPKNIKHSPIWQQYDEEGKVLTNEYYRLKQEAKVLAEKGTLEQNPKQTTLTGRMREIIHHMKESGYLGKDEDYLANVALPGQKDNYIARGGCVDVTDYVASAYSISTAIVKQAVMSVKGLAWKKISESGVWLLPRRSKNDILLLNELLREIVWGRER